jgi:hypothetical protein
LQWGKVEQKVAHTVQTLSNIDIELDPREETDASVELPTYLHQHGRNDKLRARFFRTDVQGNRDIFSQCLMQ